MAIRKKQIFINLFIRGIGYTFNLELLNNLNNTKVNKAKILLTTTDNLQSPHPRPFNSSHVSLDYLEGFIKKTTSIKKQPIIIFGANWCPDASLLEGVLQLPSVKEFIYKHCDVLNIGVGDYEINTGLFQFFDPTIEDGIPRVFILDVEGKTINLDSNDKMRSAREHSPQEIFDYLQDFVGN
jgi:thioredoxin 1